MNDISNEKAVTYSGYINGINLGTGSLTIGTPVVLSFEKVSLEPEKIFYNGRSTVVLWNDGTKTQSTASKNDIFDPEIGFAMCLMKKMFGKKVYGKKLFRKMIKQKGNFQNLDSDAQYAVDEWMTDYQMEGKKSKKEIPF